MARLIPQVIGKDAAPGERKLAKYLAQSPGADDWVIFHSLYLNNPRRKATSHSSHSSFKSAGEVDFVILIPARGIVCVEVKSHKEFRYSHGEWFGETGKRFQDPFQQARDAMYTLQTTLPKFAPWITRVPFTSLVWFTGTSADKLRSHYEFDERYYLDKRAFLGSLSDAVLGKVDEQIDHLKRSGVDKNVSVKSFGKDHIAEVEKILRPNFEIAEDVGIKRQLDEIELQELLDEQVSALSSLAENRAVKFNGAAGTGKTFLALEQARRAAEQGDRVALLCYNRNLARHLSQLQEQFEAEKGGASLEILTIHALMTKVADIPIPKSADQHFWNQTLPEEAALAMIDREPLYDQLIIDEAQDLSNATYFDFLSFILAGGLDKGKVHFFGDFENQQIYSSTDVSSLIQDRANAVNFSLNRNCRNRPKIARQVPGLSLGVMSDLFLREDDGVDPNIVLIDEQTDLENRVADLVDAYIREGFAPNEIVLLSPRGGGSFAQRSKKVGKYPLIPFDPDSPTPAGALTFSTIHAFKGLESKVIVITDIQSNFPGIKQLLYVGITRARDRLAMVSSRDELMRIAGIK